MPKFAVEIVQHYKVTRRIVVWIEADDAKSAVEQQAADEAPDFDEPDWLTGWELEDEKVTPAGEEVETYDQT